MKGMFSNIRKTAYAKYYILAPNMLVCHLCHFLHTGGSWRKPISRIPIPMLPKFFVDDNMMAITHKVSQVFQQWHKYLPVPFKLPTCGKTWIAVSDRM